MASFLGLEPSVELIQQAVSRSAADTMRKLEKSQAHLFNATKGTRQDILFVRSAKAGGWHSALPEGSISQIEQTWGHLIEWLGYELVTGVKGCGEEPAFLPSTVDGRDAKPHSRTGFIARDLTPFVPTKS
jgi:hypothetical protein